MIRRFIPSYEGDRRDPNDDQMTVGPVPTCAANVSLYHGVKLATLGALRARMFANIERIRSCRLAKVSRTPSGVLKHLLCSVCVGCEILLNVETYSNVSSSFVVSGCRNKTC